jgi:hypothetical protein
MVADLEAGARGGDAEKFGIDDVQKVTRREAIRRVDDVGLAPSDELLPEVGGQRPPIERGRQPPERQPGPTRSAIADVDAPASVHLVVRVRAKVEAAGELQPRRRPDEPLLAHEQVEHRLRRVVGRRLGEAGHRPLDETAMRHALRQRWCGLTQQNNRETRHQPRERRCQYGAGPYVRSETVVSVLAQPVDRRRS